MINNSYFTKFEDSIVKLNNNNNREMIKLHFKSIYTLIDNSNNHNQNQNQNHNQNHNQNQNLIQNQNNKNNNHNNFLQDEKMILNEYQLKLFMHLFNISFQINYIPSL
jgi:hypothetical protein